MELNIVFICDNNFVIPTGAAIQSIIDNCSEKHKYSVYVVADRLSTGNKNLFLKFKKKINIVVKDIDGSYFDKIHQYDEKLPCCASPSALLKFNLPNIFPELDKVLYLDGDIIVKRNLSGIDSENIENFYAAAVCDSGRLYFKQGAAVNIDNYFNSGVMLLNLKKMREEHVSETLIAKKRELTDFTFMDQDVFNIIFEHKVKFLDIKYNFLGISLYRSQNRFSIEDINSKYSSSYKTLKDLEKKAVIIHFSSKDKPWLYKNSRYSKLWYFYYKRSPFFNKENKLQENELVKENIYLNFLKDIWSEMVFFKVLFQNRNNKLVFWGASLFLENFIKKYKIKNKNILGIIDKNTSKAGGYIGQYEIFTPDILSEIEVQYVVFAIKKASDKTYLEVKKYIEDKNNNIKILPNIFRKESRNNGK